jgi:hypothetical protein
MRLQKQAEIAQKRLHAAQVETQSQIEAAALRISARLRAGILAQPSLGFLDDVVDFAEDVVEATEEIVVHVTQDVDAVTAVVEEATAYTPALCPLLVILGETAAIEHLPEGVTRPDQASARELLEVRKAIVAATEATAAALREAAESVQREAKAARKSRPK